MKEILKDYMKLKVATPRHTVLALKGETDYVIYGIEAEILANVVPHDCQSVEGVLEMRIPLADMKEAARSILKFGRPVAIGVNKENESKTLAWTIDTFVDSEDKLDLIK